MTLWTRRPSCVRSPSVGEYLRTQFDVRLNPTVQGFALNVWNNRSPDFAVTLKQSHNCDFARTASARDFLAPFVLVHVPRKSADVGLVRFDFAAQFVERTILHCKTDAMQHEPRRLLSDAEIACDFIATDAVLAID